MFAWSELLLIKCLSFTLVSIQIPHNGHYPFLIPRTFQLVSLSPESPVMPSIVSTARKSHGDYHLPTAPEKPRDLSHLPSQPSPPLPQAPSCSSWQPIQATMVSCGKKDSVIECTRCLSTDVVAHWNPYASVLTRLSAKDFLHIFVLSSMMAGEPC